MDRHADHGYILQCFAPSYAMLTRCNETKKAFCKLSRDRVSGVFEMYN